MRTLAAVSTIDTSDVVVREVPPEWLRAVLPGSAATSGVALMVVPEYVENDIAYFPDALLHVVKPLAAGGCSLAFADTGKAKAFKSTFSAEAELALALLVNILSNASYDALKAVFHRFRAQAGADSGRRPSIVRFGIAKPDGSCFWQELSGPFDGVANYAEKSLRLFLESHDDLPANPGGGTKSE